MADIFRSSKHPSLFPMTVSHPPVSREDYMIFYKSERFLFTLLLVILHREVVQSILVMGFLLWLEREGYTSKNLAEIIIDSLPPDVINRLADEVVICLKFTEKKPKKFDEGSNDINLLQSFLDLKRIHLHELYRNRATIFDEVSRMANEVSNKAFDDILERFIRCGKPLVVHSPQEFNVGGGVGGFRYIGPAVPFPSYDITKYLGFQQIVTQREETLITLALYLGQQTDSVLNQLRAEARHPPEEKNVPPENRTIFLTFSKGYPISESEVRNYFTRMFGDFIESICMQPVEGDDQPLFARIVARTPGMVRAVVDRDGTDGKSKYYINGKHVWARKYVKRTPAKEINGEGSASPQP